MDNLPSTISGGVLHPVRRRNQTKNQISAFLEREMEVGMSLNALVRLPMSNISRTSEEGLTKHSSLFSSLSTTPRKPARHGQRQRMLVVKAKGKKGMTNRQFQPRTPPPLPKLEDDGNPKFVLFICSAKVCISFVVSVILFSRIRSYFLNSPKSCVSIPALRSCACEFQLFDMLSCSRIMSLRCYLI